MSERVTLKMIAARAGVHFSTVSLGLRNDPRIPSKTCRRLQAIAREMGYVPDPMMRALCSYREKQRPPTVRSGIAYLTDLPSEGAFNKAIFCSARDEALNFGYSLNEFNLNEPGSSLRHFFRVWRNTGMKGVILGPFISPETHLDHDWSKWISVAYGYSVKKPVFNRVVHDHYHNMLQHLAHLQEYYGYLRIGLMLTQYSIDRTDGLHHAGYLHDRSRRGLEPITLDTDKVPEVSGVREWILRNNLEVVIGDERHFEIILKSGLAIPETVGFSLLEWRNYTLGRSLDCAGFNPRVRRAASRAVSFLASQINDQAYGQPDVPILLLVAGAFHEGRTLRPALKPVPTAPGIIGEERGKS